MCIWVWQNLILLRHTITRNELSDTDNLVVPAGVDIIIPIYHLHRDPKYWGPNADNFDPENFSEEKNANRHPCSFIPFSYGPRNCIGERQTNKSFQSDLTNDHVT